MLKNILYISIFTTCVIIAAAFLSIYHNFTATNAANDSVIHIIAIPSTFDFQTIQVIKTRKVVVADITQSLQTASSSAVLSQPIQGLISPAATASAIASPSSLITTNL